MPIQLLQVVVFRVYSAHPAVLFGPLCPSNGGTGHFVTLRFLRAEGMHVPESPVFGTAGYQDCEREIMLERTLGSYCVREKSVPPLNLEPCWPPTDVVPYKIPAAPNFKTPRGVDPSVSAKLCSTLLVHWPPAMLGGTSLNTVPKLNWPPFVVVP